MKPSMNFDNAFTTKNNYHHKGDSCTSEYYSIVLQPDKRRYYNNILFSFM